METACVRVSSQPLGEREQELQTASAVGSGKGVLYLVPVPSYVRAFIATIKKTFEGDAPILTNIVVPFQASSLTLSLVF